jgi:hypothetical protein
MDLFLFAQCLRDRGRQLEPDLTPGSSWNIHLYTNELGIAIGGPAGPRDFDRPGLTRIKQNEQLQSGKRSQRPSLDR